MQLGRQSKLENSQSGCLGFLHASCLFSWVLGSKNEKFHSFWETSCQVLHSCFCASEIAVYISSPFTGVYADVFLIAF